MLHGIRKGIASLRNGATEAKKLILSQVFMTRRDSLTCLHEPFGDAFYYGPERMSSRFEHDEKGRVDSGFENSTFRTVLDRIEREGAKVRTIPPDAALHYGKPVFIA